MTGISRNDMQKVIDLEKRCRQFEEVLGQFAHSISSSRSPDGGDDYPEKDIIRLAVEMKTYFRMKLLLGEMDIESVKTLMPHARPSEEFIKELEEEFRMTPEERKERERQMALEAADALEKKLDEMRDEEEGWDDFCVYVTIVRNFIKNDSP